MMGWTFLNELNDMGQLRDSRKGCESSWEATSQEEGWKRTRPLPPLDTGPQLSVTDTPIVLIIN